MKRCSLALLCLLLVGCGEAADRRYKIPSVFPIKERVYGRSLFSAACLVNVYSLESSFKENFLFKNLESINEEKYEAFKHLIDEAYEPWQKTPVHGNIYYMSKSAGTLWAARDCFKDSPKYSEIFYKYSSGEGAYFNSYSGEVIIYAPKENLLFYASWD